MSDVEQHPGFRLDPILTAKDPLSFCIANQRAYLFIADGKVAWGRLGKSISLNSGFACEVGKVPQVRQVTEVGQDTEVR